MSSSASSSIWSIGGRRSPRRVGSWPRAGASSSSRSTAPTSAGTTSSGTSPRSARSTSSAFRRRRTLRAELADAGLVRTRVVPLRQEASVDRESVLRRVKARHISTLQLLDEAEYAAGLHRLERELPAVVGYSSTFLSSCPSGDARGREERRHPACRGTGLPLAPDARRGARGPERGSPARRHALRRRAAGAGWPDPGAVHYPLSVVLWRLDEMPRTTRVILICRHGYSSSLAAAQLKDLGFRRCDGRDRGGRRLAFRRPPRHPPAALRSLGRRRAASCSAEVGSFSVASRVDQPVERGPELAPCLRVALERREVIGVERALRADHRHLDVRGREVRSVQAIEQLTCAARGSPPRRPRGRSASWGRSSRGRRPPPRSG